MSNKHSKSSVATLEAAALVHAKEYALVKADLFKILLVNVLFLVGLVVLYKANSQSMFLEAWVSNYLHI